MIDDISVLDSKSSLLLFGLILLSAILFIVLPIELIKMHKENKANTFLKSINYSEKIKKCLIPLFGESSLQNNIRVSRQVASNFTYKQIDYLVKYFGFIINDETIDHLNELKQTIKPVMDYALANGMMKKWLPKQMPSFSMIYISSTGRSTYTSTLTLDTKSIDIIVGAVNDLLNKQPKYIRERNKLTPIIRDSILARDNFTCCMCGNSVYKEPNLLLEVDHIIPISKGGKTEPNNLQTLCWKCNRKKSDSIDLS